MADGFERPSFTREQKIGFILLLVFSVITLSLGALQIRNTIYGPFVVRLDSDSPATLTMNEDLRLQQIDTDHDGLNDYEEINLYDTSAYLPDTDSDGTNDMEEIRLGTDPGCPEGAVCSSAETVPQLTTTTTGIPGVAAITPLDTLTGGSEGSQVMDLAAIIRNPVALRQMLLQSGQISQADLDAISDTQLTAFAEQLYSEQLRQQSANTSSTAQRP